ncbi:Avr1b-1 Avirulence-like protein [Phytophthora palmivora]|uniref:Avr1b-1 Avirulence-like protein n=1 Tax=Phytophthora palmivora TaxID=4796 RepID=A0A2P4YH74_9STRA|nr:Avr1b-1 Avirulence-like protein [Phytophthora palmivora]
MRQSYLLLLVTVLLVALGYNFAKADEIKNVQRESDLSNTEVKMKSPRYLKGSESEKAEKEFEGQNKSEEERAIRNIFKLKFFFKKGPNLTKLKTLPSKKINPNDVQRAVAKGDLVKMVGDTPTKLTSTEAKRVQSFVAQDPDKPPLIASVYFLVSWVLLISVPTVGMIYIVIRGPNTGQ